MHPHHLHALTTAWNLTASRAALAELRLNRRAVDTARDGLRSTVLGQRGGGGFGDPTGRTALLGSDSRDHLADLAQRTHETLAWLAGEVVGPYAGDPLAALAEAIPGLRSSTAAQLTTWLVEADERIRGMIGVPERLTGWPGDCPSCGQRLLQLHDAGPRPEWTVTCGAQDCVCAGEACPCRMPVRAAGVTHIWLRSVLVAPIAEQAAA